MDHANEYSSVWRRALPASFDARMMQLVLALASLAAFFALSACSVLDSSPTYRFRMIVEVDTPQGVKRGTSVYQVTAENRFAPLPEEASRAWWVKGEATMVDLPNGQTLFALLKPELTRMSMRALDPEFKGDIVESAGRITSGEGVRSPSTVEADNYPMLVIFGDLDDPTSVLEVDPADLVASFGEGYRLKMIAIELTADEVTTGIEKTLGWLPRYSDKMLDGNTINTIEAENRLANDLSQGAFSKGILQ
jgi:hypothetical protein